MELLVWSILGLTSISLSNISTLLITIKLYRDWDFRVSSVRWLFVTFFLYLWLFTIARASFYVWVLVVPLENGTSIVPLSDTQLARMRPYATSEFQGAVTNFPTLIACFCDVLHFATAFWVLPLTYELSKIAIKSMDRGLLKEQAKIRLYMIVGHALILCFLSAIIVLTILGKGYCQYTYRLAVCIYMMQILSLLYMVVVLFRLKCKGRHVEAINGQFEASPVYQRLKWMMLAYVFFALQYEFTSLVTFSSSSGTKTIMTLYIGMSQVLYDATGLALAFCTGCSLSCTLRFCGVCIPENTRIQLVIDSHHDETPCVRTRYISVMRPPVLNPVFVVTDIESSSALWAIDNGKIMQRAIQVHDDILRSLLTPYRGYEITTAGDSFQLAFHTIREAVSYCLDVQLQLLEAAWPKELHGLVPATKKQRAGRRLIFRGLRVRMGIHDALGSDGQLHQSPHVVTGKTVYTGASEVIAGEVSDLGAGGQILVTQRTADWLMTHKETLAIKSFLYYLYDYRIPHINMHVAVFEVLPEQVARRKKVFKNVPKTRTSCVYQLAASSTNLESGLETPRQGSHTSSWFSYSTDDSTIRM